LLAERDSQSAPDVDEEQETGRFDDQSAAASASWAVEEPPRQPPRQPRRQGHRTSSDARERLLLAVFVLIQFAWLALLAYGIAVAVS
jgi:hypothetical protein